jgi:hypothetical protein
MRGDACIAGDLARCQSKTREKQMAKRLIRPPSEISENHRRSISISPQLLDKQICQWEQWIDGHIAPGVMYQQQDSLSASRKIELRRRIAEIREVIIQLRGDLKLEPERVNTAQIMVGQATVLWEMLAELNSYSLRGYGEVPMELAHYIDPLGQVLTQQMHDIARLFSKPTADRAV